MIEFIAALGATKTGLEVVKGVRELLKGEKFDKGEIDSRLSQLQEAPYQAREALGDAQQEVRELNQQIDELKRVADIGKDFTFEQGVYWLKAYPYCPACWDVDRKPIRLAGPSTSIEAGMQLWDCPLHTKVHYPISRSFFMGKSRT
jgi:hypothetical protein